jgi:hypothetical protein
MYVFNAYEHIMFLWTPLKGERQTKKTSLNPRKNLDGMNQTCWATLNSRYLFVINMTIEVEFIINRDNMAIVTYFAVVHMYIV